MSLPSLQQLDPARFERADILRQLNAASRALAELKGVAASIPNQNILINTLTLQEAEQSSASTDGQPLQRTVTQTIALRNRNL